MPTYDPSGTTVLELCGQPEQKYGVRTASLRTIKFNPVLRRAGVRRSAEIFASSTRRRGSTKYSTVSAPPSGISAAPPASRLPSTSGRSAWEYNASRTKVSRWARFSSTINMVLTPLATRLIAAESKGLSARSLRTRIPRLAAASSSRPSTLSAPNTSSAV